jgi:hypothetical protein
VGDEVHFVNGIRLVEGVSEEELRDKLQAAINSKSATSVDLQLRRPGAATILAAAASVGGSSENSATAGATSTSAASLAVQQLQDLAKLRVDLDNERRMLEVMEKTMKEENDRFRADLGAEKKARAAEQVARLKVELEVGELKEQIATMQADLLTNHALRSTPIGASYSSTLSSSVIVPGKALPGTSSTGSGVLATGLLGAGIPGLTVQQLLPGVPTAGEKALQIEVEKLKTDLAAEKKAREEWAAFVPASLGASER